MIKLGIVYDNLLSPTFAGGGFVHSFEVVTRLKKDFDIIYFPSSKVLRWDKDKVKEKVKELERQGIKVSQDFYSLLDKVKEKPSLFNSEKLSKTFASAYDVSNIDFLYEPDHTSFDIFYLGGKLKKFGLAIHEPLFYNNSFEYLKRLMKFYGINPYTGKGFYTRFLYNLLFSKRIHLRLLKKYKPTFIASVSKGSLEISGINGEVIYPGNAFDPELLKYRGKGKEDYVVFWSRLNQDKGIRELPDILKIINSTKRTKLVLMGKFFDKYNEKKFWKKVKKYNLDVEYLGFVERKKLYEIVSKAKLFIYPTHVDGFSLVVLEALALGTPVVAYDIPAIRTVYSDLSAVKIVKEFDIEGIAKESLKILGMKESEIIDLMNEEKLLYFLKIHSSWNNVAESVKKILLKYIQQTNY
ncbi:glycosyltransferase [Sulfurisphaera javensis]|uniref:Glycosyltransferase n=1 Tax=Sulfurisphaera javensis TaxID=2049879 RepID=A0AAT9GN27_9CREN